jgi:hypothetical protein
MNLAKEWNMPRIKIKDLPKNKKASKEEMRKVWGGLKGDFGFSYRFWPQIHYTGVRMQQGRVQLDEDWNE